MAPGRDDLIAANSARINTAVNSPSKQTGNLAGAASSAGTQSYSGPRSRMGGNLDVVSTLDSIVFQGKEGDASMRGNVAYIRRWKRGNTAQQAGPGGATGGTGSLQDVASFAGIFGPQSTLNQDIKSVFSPENQKWLQELPSWDSSIGFTSTYIDENLRLSGDAFKDKFQAFVPGDYGRLAALEAFTPTTKLVPGGNQANNSVVVATPGNAQSTAESTTVKTAETPVTGNLKSANPNGFVNALNKVGRSALGLPPAPPTYAGDVNSLGKAASLPDGMWQFLFNPSELELEAGPEFKSAETWGVSDKSNSGQPLHWSHNKNAVLKFNSVLLNGFVFGRKVEALEQGLLELFMARDGDGQDGPHVLEFVWGKRVFGPCVIKNVSVKEKQWDEGEVVNAELSFTLEQVPEWTINDGFVDVARPGRQPTVAAPATPTTTAAPSTTSPPITPGSENPEGSPGGGQKGGGTADPSNTGSAYRACQKAYELAEVFSQVEISGNLAKANFRRDNGIVLINELFRKYEAAYSQGNSSVGTNFISRVPAQQKPPSIRKSLDSMINAGAFFERQVDLVRNAALRCKAAMENVWNTDCKKLIEDGKKAQTTASNANQTRALCAGITVGKPCNIGPGNFSPKNPCTGKNLRCNARNVYEDI